jgi:DNA-binding response OmpR family regulator
MQQFILRASSNQGSGIRIAFDDQQMQVMVSGRVVPLGPKETVLVVALLRQVTQHQQVGRVPPWVSNGDLLRLTRVSDLRALHQLVSEARAKVWAFGVDMKSVRGEGYFICGVGDEE